MNSSSISNNEQLNMVSKENYCKIIEFNQLKIPLKSLDEYLGVSDKNNISMRKEKWLSFG